MINFELIKGRIQRYSKGSLVRECLGILLEMQLDKNGKHAFWTWLVFLKWILVHAKDSMFRIKATRRDIIETVALIEKFEADQQVIDFKKGIVRGLKIIAYQQFWTQDPVTEYTFDRQLVLFSKISGQDIARDFEKRTGIPVVTFINLCYLTYVYLILDKATPNRKYTGRLEEDYYVLMERFFGKVTTSKFLNLLTLADSDDLLKIQKMRTEVYQLYEPSFWSFKPFLRVNRSLIVPHRAIFEESARHFIYNYLKQTSAAFPEQFGSRMEKYIELGLIETKIPYLNEKNLKGTYPELTKTSDFLVQDSLLVESKAIELHPRSGILRNQNVLFNEFEGSIIKAYKQMISTASSIDRAKEWKGIVVTYKETYSGFGNDAWDEFLKDEMEQFVYENHISLNVLPPQNLCIINLRDWDHLVQVVKEGRESFEGIVSKAIQLNASDNPSEKILLFEQALRVQFPIGRPDLSFLNEAHDLIFTQNQDN